MNVLKELRTYLQEVDPAEVCSLLDITSEQLVDRFDNVIEDKIEDLAYLVMNDTHEKEDNE